jgi:hypothetical protein
LGLGKHDWAGGGGGQRNATARDSPPRKRNRPHQITILSFPLDLNDAYIQTFISTCCSTYKLSVQWRPHIASSIYLPGQQPEPTLLPPFPCPKIRDFRTERSTLATRRVPPGYLQVAPKVPARGYCPHSQRATGYPVGASRRDHRRPG